MTVIGARPQFIKTCALSRAVRETGRFREIIVHTGQHYDRLMSKIFFDELNIPRPHYHLGVGSAGHGEQTGIMLEKLESVMVRETPELVIVPGDTNSTLAGALAAAKLGIPVAHVEAGMRCGDPGMPEEINRKVTDRISTLFFCPTRTAVDNLKREGITKNVFLYGDVMVDSFAMFQPVAIRRSKILERLKIKRGGYYLLTVHRAENTDDARRLRAILKGCAAAEYPIVFPVHPRTGKIISAAVPLPAGIKAIKPVSYTDMLALESGARAIVTDSGGVQKEAYLSGVPCITLRAATEWPETVDAGWNVLTGADPAAIRHSIKNFKPQSRRKPVLGPAGASHRIAAEMEIFLRRRAGH